MAWVPPGDSGGPNETWRWYDYRDQHKLGENTKVQWIHILGINPPPVQGCNQLQVNVLQEGQASALWLAGTLCQIFSVSSKQHIRTSLGLWKAIIETIIWQWSTGCNSKPRLRWLTSHDRSCSSCRLVGAPGPCQTTCVFRRRLPKHSSMECETDKWCSYSTWAETGHLMRPSSRP